jgi:GDP-4-dehydro-6-deoxy-D-mannose reductase
VISGVALPDNSIPNSIPFDLRDEESVDTLVRRAVPFDWVVHLAAITFVPDAGRSPVAVMDVNLLGSVRLLDALKRHAPTARVLFVGSSEAYGPPQSLPVTESHPLNPSNPYAISKAAADLYCEFAQRATGLDIIRARPFNHSGAGQSDAFVLSSFARQIAEIEAGRRPPTLSVGDLNVARDFSHVADVVRAYQLLLEHGRPGEAYNVCSGKSVRIKDAVDLLLAKTDLEVEIQVEHDRLRAVDIPEIRGNHDKLSADTAWQPEHGLGNVLTDLLDYWRNRQSTPAA